MAKKHHTKKHHKGRRKHRKVGAFGLKQEHHSLLVTAGVGLATFFLDTQIGINTMIDSAVAPLAAMLPASAQSMVPMLTTGAELGVGTLLLTSKKKHLGTEIGAGVALGLGAHRLMKQLGVMSGYQAVPVLGTHRRVTGFQDVPVLGGNNPMGINGYRVNGGYVPHGSGGVMGSVDGGNTNRDGSGCMS